MDGSHRTHIRQQGCLVYCFFLYITEKMYLCTREYQTIMKKLLLQLLAVSVAATFFVSCQKEEIIPEPVHEKPHPGVYSLPLIETTDIHGHIVAGETEVVHYRMAYIADKVKDIRGHDGL